MHFQDLSRYNYTEEEENTLNIGWLDPDYEYTKGVVDEYFLERLSLFLDCIVHDESFGPHTCGFCRKALASGEIRVFGLNGVVYAAPTMIDHYIMIHKYQPPQAFIDAVMNGPLPGTIEYSNLAAKYSWSTHL